jgi:hypothetical protein
VYFAPQQIVYKKTVFRIFYEVESFAILSGLTLKLDTLEEIQQNLNDSVLNGGRKAA